MGEDIEERDYYEIEIEKYFDSNENLKKIFLKDIIDPIENYINLLNGLNEFYIENKSVIDSEKYRVGNDILKIIENNNPKTINEVLYFFYKTIINLIDSKKTELFEVFNFNYCIEELNQLNHTIFIHDIKSIVFAKLTFEPEEFIRLLIHDLGISAIQDTLKIKQNLRHSSILIQNSIKQEYFYLPSSNYSLIESDSFDHEKIFDSSLFGEEPIKMENFIGKAYSEKTINQIIKNQKIQNSKYTLNVKERLILNNKYHIKQLIFLIRLSLKNTEVNVRNKTIKAKIEHTCHYSIFSPDTFKYTSQFNYHLLIDFITPGIDEKILDLFIILDKDFDFFTFSIKKRKDNVNVNALKHYFDYYLKNTNKKAPLSKNTIQGKIDKKKKDSSPLYRNIEISPNRIKRILGDLSLCNEKFFENH